jgi:hypothetical protein
VENPQPAANEGAINETKGDEANADKGVVEGENKALTNLDEVQNKGDKKGKKKSVGTTEESCKCLIF